MANNKIQIKRSTSNATVTGLSAGELAFTQASNTLHIGLPDGSGVLRIGGAQYPGVLTNSHALVANATGGIDKVIVANIVPTTVWANGAAGIAGDVLTSNGTAVYWRTPSAGVAGSDTQVQFNDGGNLAGDAGLTFNKTTDTLSTNSLFATSTVNAATLSVGSSVIANSSRLAIGTAVGLQANGGIGSAGQILYSNGTTVYWAAAPTGDITSVTAGSGLTGGGTSGDVTLDVGAGNGISVSADAIAVLANSGLVANATGVHIVTSGDTTLIANASGLFVNDASLSIATSQLTGDVALGTQTSGNYVATITAGSGISGSGTGEGSTPTIAVVANSGIVSNATGVFVLANSGLVSNSTGVFVLANNGIIANSTGVFARAANGISVDSSGINVVGGSGLVSNATGVHIGQGNGIAVDADSIRIQQANGIAVDSGGVRVDASSTGGLVANATGLHVSAGSGLLTNATGLHVGSGNGISVSADAVAVTGGSTLTVNATGVHVNSTLNITDLTLTGNLTVLGDLVSLNVATIAVEDSMITLAKDQSNTATFTDAVDIGFFGTYGNTSNAFISGLIRDQSDSGIWKLFVSNGTYTNTAIDTANTNAFRLATLQAFITSAGFTTNSTSANLIANSTYTVGIVANAISLSGRANNDLLFTTATGSISGLALGTSGFVLQSNGTAIVYDTLDGGTF